MGIVELCMTLVLCLASKHYTLTECALAIQHSLKQKEGVRLSTDPPLLWLLINADVLEACADSLWVIASFIARALG